MRIILYPASFLLLKYINTYISCSPNLDIFDFNAPEKHALKLGKVILPSPQFLQVNLS